MTSKFIVLLVLEDGSKQDLDTFDSKETALAYIDACAEEGKIFSLEERNDFCSTIIF